MIDGKGADSRRTANCVAVGCQAHRNVVCDEEQVHTSVGLDHPLDLCAR
jgi:hypothetical protein